MKKLNALNLGKSLDRNEMKNVNGGKVVPVEWNCWCDGIRNGYCTAETNACCDARC